jgi:hypothetical protein
MKYEIFFGVIPPTAKSYLFSRRELLELLLVPSLGIHAETLSNFVVNKQEHFQTMLILGIGTIFIDQLPTFHVFKKCVLCWHQNLQQSTIRPQKSYE